VAYEVFISYSSADREWASKLHADLAARNITAFYDQASLRDGAGWEQQIKSALLASRHLVCLWSAKASMSQWVQRELALFDTKTPPTADAAGSLLLVQLDSTLNAYSSLQQIAEAPVAAAYAVGQAGLESLAAADWKKVINRVNDVVKRNSKALLVPVALLTLTRPQAEELGPSELSRIQTRLGLDKAAVLDRYGDSRLAWRPFGGTQTIEALLDQVSAMLNAKLAPETVEWELPSDDFWNTFESAQAFSAAMQQRKLGAIVIDPVALSNNTVMAKLQVFTSCLQHENIAIIAVPPFAANPQTTSFRRWIEEFASSIVQTYFDPPLHAESLCVPRCGIGLDDASELRRLVQTSIGQFKRASRRDSQQPVTPTLAN